jgi:hypothetical protein
VLALCLSASRAGSLAAESSAPAPPVEVAASLVAFAPPPEWDLDAPTPSRTDAGAAPSPDDFDLGLRFPQEPSLRFGHSEIGSPEPEHRLRPFLAALVSAGAVAGAAANSFPGGASSGFHFQREGFFGADTYAGGVDKASHLVEHYLAARTLAAVFRQLGYRPSSAAWMGSGLALLRGLVTEAGDGTTAFGFSWEDALVDALGAGSALVLEQTGWTDTFGFRLGTSRSRRRRLLGASMRTTGATTPRRSTPPT